MGGDDVTLVAAVPAAIVVAATLWIESTRSLRLAAFGLLAQFAATSALTVGIVARTEIALLGAAGLAASVILYVAARDGAYGEDPGWRVWPALAISAGATALAFLVFSSADFDRYLQLSAFWLLSCGLAMLLTARTPARTVLGALLMLSGTQLVLRFDPNARLGLTIVFAWIEVLLALVGAFLIVQRRAVEDGR